MKKAISAFLLFFTGISAQSNVDYTAEVFPIFSSAGCLSGYCHGAGGSSGNLTMGSDAATVYSNIVDVASTCNSMDLIEPNDPSTSHLYLKCTTSWSCGGSRMPRNNTSYFSTNSDQLETIRVWIAEGALEQAQETDTTPPELVNLSIDQDTLDLVNGPDTVSFTIIARDAGSGLSTGLGKLLHSNNTDEVMFTVAFTSGDSLDTVAFDIVMSDTSTLGNWDISYIQLTDVDGNDTTYTTTNLAANGFDFGFVLVNSSTVAVESDSELIPGTFVLYPNYPNPFNPTTTIRFSVGNTDRYSLHVYDITGRVVDELINAETNQGQYEIRWDASRQPSGVYVAYLISGGKIRTQKLILLK